MISAHQHSFFDIFSFCDLWPDISRWLLRVLRRNFLFKWPPHLEVSKMSPYRHVACFYRELLDQTCFSVLKISQFKWQNPSFIAFVFGLDSIIQSSTLWVPSGQNLFSKLCIEVEIWPFYDEIWVFWAFFRFIRPHLRMKLYLPAKLQPPLRHTYIYSQPKFQATTNRYTGARRLWTFILVPHITDYRNSVMLKWI